MMITHRPADSAADWDSTVPTVARLHRLRRCIGTDESSLRRGRCPRYTHTALAGHPLCRRHLAAALPPADIARRTDGAEELDRSRELLGQVLFALRAGLPDPGTPDQLLAVVPTSLIARIDAALGLPSGDDTSRRRA